VDGMTGQLGRGAWVATTAAGVVLSGLALCLVAASAAPATTALLLGLLGVLIWVEVSR
jgi:xanthosine utilization system XapX-like protein